jgi:hypothetical protein
MTPDKELAQAILELKEQEMAIIASMDMCEDKGGLAYRALEAIAEGYSLAIDILYGFEVIE